MRTFLGLLALTLLLAMQAQARDTYVGIYGGANWDDVLTHPVVDSQRGYVMGGVLGTDIPAVPGLYVEADMSYRGNEVDVLGGKIKADHDTFALLGNVLYQIPVSLGPVHPYALVGAGYGHAAATFEDVHILSLESSGFAWQIGGGLNARVTDGVTVGLGYRYFQGPTLEVLGTELSDGGNHSVIAELRVAL